MTKRVLILVLALTRASSAQTTLHLDGHGNGRLDAPAVWWLSSASVLPAAGRVQLSFGRTNPESFQLHAEARKLDASAHLKTPSPDFWRGWEGKISLRSDYADATSATSGELELHTPPLPELSLADLEWHGSMTGYKRAQGHLTTHLVGPLVEELPLQTLDVQLQQSGDLTTVALSVQGQGLPLTGPAPHWFRGWLDDHGFEVVDAVFEPHDGSSLRVRATVRNLAENWHAGGYRDLLLYLQRTRRMSLASVGLALTLVNTALRALPTNLAVHLTVHGARLDATADSRLDGLDHVLPALLAEQAQTLHAMEGEAGVAPDPWLHLLGRAARSGLRDFARVWRQAATDPQEDEQSVDAHLHAERGAVQGRVTLGGGHAAFWRAVRQVLPGATVDTCHQAWQATLASSHWSAQSELHLTGLWTNLLREPWSQAVENTPELAEFAPALQQLELRDLTLNSGGLRLRTSPLTSLFATRAPGLDVVALEQARGRLRWRLRGLPSDPAAAATACARLAGETPVVIVDP